MATHEQSVTVVDGEDRSDGFLDGQAILARVEALGPLIEADADAVQERQHLTDRLKRAMAEAGVFRVGFPSEGWGGPDMRLEDQVRMMESIAYHDASTAWNAMVLGDGGFFAPLLDDVAARELFPSLDLALAGSTRPAGKAVEVEDGYLLSGHWSFGSGIRDADVVYAGFYRYSDADGEPVRSPSGQPALHHCFIPLDAIQMHDAWYTTGLAGSGSTEYSVRDVVVPRSWMYEHSAHEGSPDLPPLSRYAGAIVVNEAGVPLGIARRAIDEFRKVVEKPTRLDPDQSMKTQDPYVPAAYAEAVALYEAARAYALRTTTDLSDTLFSGGALTPAQEGAIMQVVYMSGTMCRQALEALLECLGARSVLADYPFDRLYRDMSTAIRHGNHRRKALEMAGITMLQLPWPAHLAE